MTPSLPLLARAADDSEFLAKLADNPAEALSGYYTLTQDEVAALVSGDIKRIESWVGKLDKRHATWLRKSGRAYILIFNCGICYVQRRSRGKIKLVNPVPLFIYHPDLICLAIMSIASNKSGGGKR
ncbi:Os1348 family NHLP clan protein [Chloroflexota bacterium]